MSSTMAGNDRRFADKSKKYLQSTTFPANFGDKVDLRKVNVPVFRSWLVKRTEEMLGFEDEVVVEFVMGMLEDPDTRSPDPRQIQSLLLGFLSEHTASFTAKLWDLLLSAQQSPGGVPVEFVEEKKRELREADERDRQAASGRFRGGGGAPPQVAPGVGGGFMNQIANRGGASGGGGGYGGGGQRGPPQGMTRDSGYGPRSGSRFDQSSAPPARDYGRPSTRDRSPPPPARRGRSPSPIPRRRYDSRSPPDRYRRDHRDHRPSPPRRRSPTPPPRGHDTYIPRRSPSPERRRYRTRSPEPDYHHRQRRPRSPAPREPSRTPPRKARHRSFTPTPPPDERTARGRSRTRSRSP